MGGISGVKMALFQRGKRVKMGHPAGIQGVKEGHLEHNFLPSGRLVNLETIVRILQREKAQGGFKDVVYSEEMNSLNA